jgi:predicted Mrr-cat superfamily restriction endonuclease
VVGIHYSWASSNKDLFALSRAEIAEEAQALEPTLSAGAVLVVATQFWTFVHEIAIGDMVFVPGERGRTFSLARIAGSAERADPGSALSFVRPVEWVSFDRDTGQMKDDLRNSLGSIQTVFTPRAPGSMERIQAIAVLVELDSCDAMVVD